MVRPTALFLTVLTGLAGLFYEVAWQRFLAVLLGSHGEATAAVLALFLGGLAAGYALFARVTRRMVARARARGTPPRLLLGYGLVEAGIGAWALAFPLLFAAAQRLSLFVPPGHAGIGFAFDVALCALLIVPPTALMGATIPMLTLALAGDVARSTRVHAWVYGCNTLGAFLGALLGAFWILPALGLDGGVRAMGLVNLAVGAAFALLSGRAGALAPRLGEAGAPARAVRIGPYAAIALLTGFAMMAIQVALNRIGALALGSSHFTFAMVVAVFVLSIALGSLAVSALPRVPEGLLSELLWLLWLLLCLLYLGVPEVPYAAHVMRTLFQSVGPAFAAFHFFVFLALLAVLVVPIGLSGALLPLLFDRLRRDAGELGAAAGRLYAWNTVGSLAGALVGGYLLLFWLDLHHVWRIALLAIAASAAIASWRTSRLPRVGAGALLAASFVALLWLPAWTPERMSAGLFRIRSAGATTYRGSEVFFAGHRRGEVVYYDDDPTSTAAVLRGRAMRDGRPNLSLLVNGKSDGNLIGDYPTMALAALLPAWMAAGDARAFVIGLGTGVTAGELAALDGVREIEVAEISQGVIDALPLFDPGNLGASHQPEVRIRRGDAYRALLQGDGRFDVIVSEPSNPWVTGVEMLYSVEFLAAAKQRLAPGGVFAQWFHTYETDTATVELVLRNFASVFPQVSVWFTLGTDLVLLGRDAGPGADVAVLEQRFLRPDFRAGFARAGIESFPALLAHEVLPAGVVRAEALPGPLHTLRHPILSDRAARAFFAGGRALLPRFATPAGAEIGRRNSLLRRYAAAPDGSLPEEILSVAATETCHVRRFGECATFLALWRREFPDSKLLESALAEARRRDEATEDLGDRGLERIAALFGDGSDLRNGAATPLARARATTQRFASHYHHAAPFDRRALEAVWGRCRSEDCDAARRRFEERLGPLL